jgi:hypothetical protein
MASVRMSKQLKDLITNKARDLFSQPYSRALDALAEDYGDRLMTDVCTNDFDKYIPLIPESWCTKIDEASGYITGDYKGEVKKYYVSFNLVKKYTVPNIRDLMNHYRGNFEFKDYKPSQDLFDEYAKYEARKEKIDNERKEFVDKITQSLDRCNTLKQFLDVWPDGEQLVPEDVMIKYNTEPVKPPPRETMDPEITTELSSVLMRRKIGDTIHK